MFFYSPEAITFKTINKFSYETYTDISLNMLKYTNDSSTTFRVLDALTSVTRETLDDLPYSTLFTAANISYRQIDRLHKFYLDTIPNSKLEINADSIICKSSLTGYSKYTDRDYTLEYIENKNDFVRHSYPCDCFITKKVYNGSEVYVTLEPNIWKDININVHDSAISIKPMGPMDRTTKDASQVFITILIEGIDTRNELVQENININYWCEYRTYTEFIFINKIKVLNSFVSFDLILCPYVDGKEDIWHNIVSDREEFDRRNAIVKFNTATKKLEFSQIYNESISFPTPVDLIKTVEITGLGEEATIYDYYIDQPNGLFYVITSENKLYCYPFIIPKGVTPGILDTNKTINQSFKIEYFEDAQREVYSFDVFPTSKANGIDELDVIINGLTYKDGMIVDLFREKLIDNRIEIPFDVLFTNKRDCLVEFKSYGSEFSLFSVYLIKSQIDPLYIKDLGESVSGNPVGSEFVFPNDRSTSISHPVLAEPIVLTSGSKIYKLSRYGNIIIDGYLITDVFKTFYYSEEDNSIITSDTITNITAANTEGQDITEEDTTEDMYGTYRYK